MLEIKRELASSKYEVLRKEPHLGKHIQILGLGGSLSYGTDLPTSDVDIRGIASNTEECLFGDSNFNSFDYCSKEGDLDISIFSVARLFEIIRKQSITSLDILGLKEEHYIYVGDVGRYLIDNRKHFVSKKMIGSINGFVNNELRLAENYMSRDVDANITKKNRIELSLSRFNEKYMELGVIAEIKDDGLFISGLNGLEFETVNDIINYGRMIKKDIRKKEKTYELKDIKSLTKHLIHTLRAIYQGMYLLEQHDLCVYLEDKVKELRGIRNGKFIQPDGSLDTSLLEHINNQLALLNEMTEKSDLRDTPDWKKVTEICINAHKMYLDRQ